MRVAFINARDTWPLRSKVLRPGQPITECDYPNDRAPDTFHLGVLEEDVIIGIGSFYRERHDSLRGWKQYRLRGMAVDPAWQGKGTGSTLMRFGIDHLRAIKADLLWCNARDNALDFYLGLGMRVHGEGFDIPGIGPHHRMAMAL